MRELVRLTGVFVGVVVLAAGCSSSASTDRAGTYEGAGQQLGNGTIRTYVAVDSDGHPTEIGVRLTKAALDGLPAVDPAPDQPLTIDLPLPSQAAGTDFDHVTVNWNAQGHAPTNLFGVPHFDFHFYMTDMAAQHAIDPTVVGYSEAASNVPAPQYVPQDYLMVPDSAFPMMGVHWVDGTVPLDPSQFHFTQILINGSWDGKYTFIEPMITRAYLLSDPSLTQDLKQPQAFQKTGYFPTRYSVQHDADFYTVALTGMAHHDAA
ncbi:DUF5602 domain-containing protein [Nocardia tengchongensis]|uniref:DUF5602 domain-containing protein n=1 Tax=Nocardia tengchongensis TaxID=2055889 RepID=UPI003617D34B